jgi:thiaminase (transcriptional activator TenA)
LADTLFIRCSEGSNEPGRMLMAISEMLLREAGSIRQEISHHPFVTELKDGTLATEKFRFYLEQDYLFLIEYCRVFGLAVAKARDLAIMTRLAQLLRTTLEVEMDLHRSYSAEFGISRERLEQAEASAVTHAYTRHLLNVAWSGGLGEILASLLPCQWGYWELGLQLAENGGTAADNPYRQWVVTYSSPEFGELASWLREVVDGMAEGAGKEERTRMEREYMASSRYELLFWDMAWRQEAWPASCQGDGSRS